MQCFKKLAARIWYDMLIGPSASHLSWVSLGPNKLEMLKLSKILGDREGLSRGKVIKLYFHSNETLCLMHASMSSYLCFKGWEKSSYSDSQLISWRCSYNPYYYLFCILSATQDQGIQKLPQTLVKMLSTWF